MSDFNSSLPVRTEQNGDVVSRISDGNVTSQLLAVNADGSINITDNDGSLTVDATNLDIRDLAFASDKVDVSGSTVDLSATTLAALESITVQNGPGAAAVNIQDGENSITVDAIDLDIRDLTFASDKVDVSGSDVTATVTATDLDIRDLTAASDSVAAWLKDGAGTAITSTTVGAKQALDVQIKDASGNALGTTMYPISVVSSVNTEGDEVNAFDLGNNISAGATSTHTYTVTTGKIFFLTQIEASASGKAKIEVRVETGVGTNTFVTKFVQFNSSAEPNMSIKLSSVISVAAGVRVQIIKTNRDLLPQDLYSTISGIEVTP